MDFIGEAFNLILVQPMTNVLVAIARMSGGNFGVAIVIFTIIMRFVTWPLTSSQYKQSRAMQAIQPRVQELQKKYKGKDPKKMQQEMMQLYREAGVNPLGCLFPLIAQMPIWIALYLVIQRTLGDTPESFVKLSQTLYPIPYVHGAVPLENHFLIWDLGQPDRTLLLPILVGVTMYVQQKMITPRPQGQLTQQQLQQQQTQQMMTWMMPLMFAYFTWTVPAGLGLYWFVTNIVGIITQYFYLGRKVDWRSMLQIAPPAPQQTAVRERVRVNPEQKTQDGASTDTDAEEEGPSAVPATRAGPEVRRRKRHGRRRGKR